MLALDLRMNFARMCYSPDFDNMRDSYLKSLPSSLKTFEEYLGDKTWLTGDKINYPDFSLCELLNELEKFEPSCLSEFPKLKAYLTRFEVADIMRNLEIDSMYPEFSGFESSCLVTLEDLQKLWFALTGAISPIGIWFQAGHSSLKSTAVPFEENPKKELREIDDEINDLRSAFEDFSNDADYLGQQIRLLLTYCGEKFDQELYEVGPAPEFSREQWLSKKYNLGLDFPNLPYLIAGDFKLTHSTAILEYIADRNNMLPKSPEEQATLLMINLAAVDVRNHVYYLTFGPDYEKNKVEYMKNLPTEIKSLADYLGDKKFFSGEKINYPDFNIYDLLILLRTYSSDCLDAFPSLQAYIKRFEEIPSMKKYMNSPAYIHRPFTNTMAHWGYYMD
nr:glutathione S transferase [Hymenolepis microstoma]